MPVEYILPEVKTYQQRVNNAKSIIKLCKNQYYLLEYMENKKAQMLNLGFFIIE